VTLLDFLVAVILGLSVASGFVTGFVRVGIGFLAVICGVVVGFWNYGMAAEWAYKYIPHKYVSAALANLLGFFLIFSGILALGALISKVIARIFRWIGLSWLDRLLGALFGFVRGSLVVVAFVAVLMAFVPKPMPNWMVDSKSLPYAIDASNRLADIAPAGIKNAFRDSLQEIQQVWQDQLQEAHKKLLRREAEHKPRDKADPDGKK
jgi:membrane protein required for colicin V production